jgi:PIN domain nuclease of toxin-antitoxin system
VTLLLDTHVLLWWLFGDPRLTPTMRKAIADPTSTVVVSAVTAWEMAIKAAVGKLAVPDRLIHQLDQEGFEALPVTVEDGLAAGALPRNHSDPFDRMLIAQAARRRLVVVTADRRFADYDVLTLS